MRAALTAVVCYEKYQGSMAGCYLTGTPVKETGCSLVTRPARGAALTPASMFAADVRISSADALLQIIQFKYNILYFLKYTFL